MTDLRAELAAQKAFTLRVAEKLADASEVIGRLSEPVNKEKIAAIVRQMSTINEPADVDAPAGS